MYNFACSEEFKARNFFIYFMCAASFITFIACMTPAMSTPKLRPFRAAMFVILGLSATSSLVYLGYGADKRYINPEWNATPYV
jgi:predicted membrane channel-forming protein YqfA (hemolysin III family)